MEIRLRKVSPFVFTIVIARDLFVLRFFRVKSCFHRHTRFPLFNGRDNPNWKIFQRSTVCYRRLLAPAIRFNSVSLKLPFFRYTRDFIGINGNISNVQRLFFADFARECSNRPSDSTRLIQSYCETLQLNNFINISLFSTLFRALESLFLEVFDNHGSYSPDLP